MLVGDLLQTNQLFCRNIQEDVSTDAEIPNGDHQSSGGSPSVEKVEIGASAMKAVRILSLTVNYNMLYMLLLRCWN